jgi:hypothetical protein
MSKADNARLSDRIIRLIPTLAILTTDLHCHKQPELELEYGTHSKTKCQEEVAQYLRNLAAALEVNQPAIFADFIAWSNKVHLAHGVPTSILVVNLECLAQVLAQELPEKIQTEILDQYLSAGLAVLN